MQKHGWKDAEGKTLQQKMDLGGMPELPKGFGSVGRNVPETDRTMLQPAEGGGIGKLPGRSPEEETKKIIKIGDIDILLEGHRKKPDNSDVNIGKWSEEDFIESILKKVPRSHLKGLNKINISYNQIYADDTGNIEANALYKPRDKEIVLGRIYRAWAPKDAESEKESTETLLHEIAHHYHYVNMPASIWVRIEASAKSDNNSVFDINQGSAKEYISKAYAVWHNNNEVLANRQPVSYNILKDIFEETP